MKKHRLKKNTNWQMLAFLDGKRDIHYRNRHVLAEPDQPNGSKKNRLAHARYPVSHETLINLNEVGSAAGRIRQTFLFQRVSLSPLSG